jgi:hypothetical protein
LDQHHIRLSAFNLRKVGERLAGAIDKMLTCLILNS